jgi:predicted DNA-binding protein with PD1-like motif
MKFKSVNETSFLLVFDRGDEIAATLTSFAREHAIHGASFTAIGACRSAAIAYWNPDTKDYEQIEVSEQVEVVSLNGNIALGEDGQPRVHAHVALGKRDGTLVGGHFLSGVVYPTLELFLIGSTVALQRRKDTETGLPLIVSS